MTTASKVLDRVLVLEMVRVTEAAAIAASALTGRGDEKAADAAAVEAMRQALNELYMDGTVVIGEGERVAEGVPEAVAKEPRSFTGRYLAPLLGMSPSAARGEVEGERVAAE